MPIFFILNPLPTQNSLPGDAAAKETAPNNIVIVQRNYSNRL